MKTIESKNDFIAWATEINHGVTLARKCDMQDIYGHTSVANIDKLFLEADGARKLILCSVSNCMSFEEVERLIVVLAKSKVNKMLAEEQNELDKEWSKISHEKAQIAGCRNNINKRISLLSRRNTHLEKKNMLLADLHLKVCEQLHNIQDNNKTLTVKADKYDKLRSLLA